VLVCPGTYNEDVSIQGKAGLTLESTDGADVTTVDGTGTTGVDTILADSNDVTIDGFTVTGAGRFGINQNIGVSNLDILDNVILDNPNIGVVAATNGGEVSGNLFDGNGSGLYFTTNASNITATDNDFDDNGAGIIFETGNTNNTVQSNNILNNGEGILFFEGGTGFANNDISQNRIFGNDIGLDNNSDTPVTAENNWWGCNEGPNNDDGCDTTDGTVDTDPWIVMDIRADPMIVNTGGSSEIKVRFLLNKGEGDLMVARDFPDGALVEFDAMRGMVDPKQDETTNGTAMTTLTTNSQKKAAVVTAELDAEKVKVRIKIRR
ncbi:MAG: right-handed parallel beta-helix repeat-containing protein, partial [Rubrobacteraceae bacterium]